MLGSDKYVMNSVSCNLTMCGELLQGSLTKIRRTDMGPHDWFIFFGLYIEG